MRTCQLRIYGRTGSTQKRGNSGIVPKAEHQRGYHQNKAEVGRSFVAKDRIVGKTAVQENVPRGKRSLGRPRLRWDDRVEEDTEEARPGMDWRELAMDMEIWRQICRTTWSWRPKSRLWKKRRWKKIYSGRQNVPTVHKKKKKKMGEREKQTISGGAPRFLSHSSDESKRT